MAYDNSHNNKNQKGRKPAGASGGKGPKAGGVKKYPADKNFYPAGEHTRRDGKPAYDREKKPYGDRPRDDRGGQEFKSYEKKQYDRAELSDREDEGSAEAEGLVIGRNAVRELLRSDRTVDKLLVRRGDREGSIVVLVAEAVEKGIPVVEVDKTKLDSLAGFVPHQGVIAMVAQKEYCSVEDILAVAAERGEKPFIVIADGITDPYNLGALIRCAEGCGAHGLIIPRRRAVGLTALVAKSSAGAMEHLAVAKVANIHQTVLDLQKAGVWVYAAEAGGSAHYNTNFEGPCALVMGSEGEGVSRVVKDACDGIVSIPMYGHVNSFNVSTAASVILAEIARQHHKE